MRVAKEEIFGPVLVIITYDTEEEAIEMMNLYRDALDNGDRVVKEWREYNYVIYLSHSPATG